MKLNLHIPGLLSPGIEMYIFLGNLFKLHDDTDNRNDDGVMRRMSYKLFICKDAGDSPASHSSHEKQINLP